MPERVAQLGATSMALFVKTAAFHSRLIDARRYSELGVGSASRWNGRGADRMIAAEDFEYKAPNLEATEKTS